MGIRRRSRQYLASDPSWRETYRFLAGIPSAHVQIFYDHG